MIKSHEINWGDSHHMVIKMAKGQVVVDEQAIASGNPQLIKHNVTAQWSSCYCTILGRELRRGGWWGELVGGFDRWEGPLTEENWTQKPYNSTVN
uniref:Uncharacterized protein n=1 Tax=Oryza nivara TaxID=4536 RepID=A0A0E0HLV2_ORYNI